MSAPSPLTADAHAIAASEASMAPLMAFVLSATESACDERAASPSAPTPKPPPGRGRATSEPLRPCPFCGERAGDLLSRGFAHWVRCGACGASGPSSVNGPDAAVHRWQMQKGTS
jgi:hypothetical protein